MGDAKILTVDAARTASETPAAGAQLNVADRLASSAKRSPDAIAVACPGRGSKKYATITFADLDGDASRIAGGLVQWGVRPGTRIALLVRPGIEFVTLVFALLRAGAVIVLVDPGLGKRNLVRCLADAEPEGFIAIPMAQAARLCLRRKFAKAKWNVTVGRRSFWGGETLDQIRRRGESLASLSAPCPLLPAPTADDPAAIIFTSGSTGPPKGVLYTHRMFDTQVSEIQSMYGIEPGGVDLSCFPLFALFNSAMGVTTVLPSMDFSRPASADPRKLLAAANDWKVTQAFASPAVWRKLSEQCGRTGERIETLREIFSCGATVPADVLRATLKFAAPNARMHTPYGATECLPVATIEAQEVLGETAVRTDAGAGVCVGRKFDSIEWRVIRITDEPIPTIDDAEPLPVGDIGELIVRGPQASPRYVTRAECNADAKIADVGGLWHRMGDVGYLDDQGRFWYCGRKSQRVVTANGPLFTECIEAVFNGHRDIEQSALVGVGPRYDQFPVVAIKFKLHVRITRYSGRGVFADFDALAAKVVSDISAIDWLDFDDFLYDVRHNVKIQRELLQSMTVGGILPELDQFPPALAERAKIASHT
jgi:acyl-CoA synthetase (AMP-forming)/AMP-acid ligase II